MIFCCLCAVVYLNAAGSQNKLPRVDVTITCNNATFDAELEKALASLKDGQSLRAKKDGDNYTFTVNDDGGDTGPAEVIRCEGGGMKFARCAKSALDKYGCQKITKLGDDKYKSEDC